MHNYMYDLLKYVLYLFGGKKSQQRKNDTAKSVPSSQPSKFQYQVARSYV